MKPLLDEDTLRRLGFFATRLASRLAEQPLGIIDVGARWGVSDLFLPIRSLAGAVAVEADRDEAERLRAANAAAGWAHYEVLEQALSKASRQATLYVTRRANNSSLLPVDSAYARRYDLAGLELEKIVPIATAALDDCVVEGRFLHPNAGEVIKLDTQGTERDVLDGAMRLLTERTVCLIVEVSFFTVYRGGNLFGDIDVLVRPMGFCCYGLLNREERSTRRLDKRRNYGRERLMQADAIFFRDPFEPGAIAMRDPARQRDVLFVMSLLLGYHDFCAELADAVPDPEERQALRALSAAAAAADCEALRDDVAALQVQVGQSQSPNVDIGRFVDRHRDFHTFHEIQ
jgi:FkbM family methyltransferase